MRVPTIFLFSGQGSQYFQMGRALFEQDVLFRESMTAMDVIARDLVGASILDALYREGRGKSDSFDRIELTNPAIFMVEYALAQTLIRRGVAPDIVLGTSLGSFAAAAVSGRLTMEEGLTAVIRLANALADSCDAGGMVAVLAPPALYDEEFMSANSALVGINFATHFVVSALNEALAGIERELRNRNITYQRLPVPFAFHSRWIDNAAAPFASLMQSVRLRKGEVPMFCCDRAAVADDIDRDFFWNVVRRPIRFRDATVELERSGPYRYIDVGPAGTLATFLKYGLPRHSASKTHGIMSLFGREIENVDALVQSTDRSVGQ